MYKVAVNTRFLLSDKLEGFGWYSYETLRRLVALNPEITFYFFFDRSYDKRFLFAQNIIPVVLNPPARHPILFKIWFDFSVTRALKKYKIDLFLSPDGYLSLRTEVPQIGVIHDLNFEHFPDDLPKSASKYLRSYFPRFAKRATHLLTVSEFSKSDICALYGIDPMKITVAYNGADEDFKPTSRSEQDEIRLKYTQGSPFFLFVGALHPRKNLFRLMKAFELFRSNVDADVKLLIVGEAYYWSKRMKEAYESHAYKDSILFTGHLSKSELIAIYGSALSLAFVSYFEGFGIPIVEAMRCHCPVIVGQHTACHEVAADAALICDPFSIESIHDALTTIYTDNDLRERLITSGYERSLSFTWDETARIMSQTIDNVLTSFQKST